MKSTLSPQEHGTIYAVGDIHGELKFLRVLLRRVADDITRNPSHLPPHIVFMGDYIDRGDEPRGVIETLLKRLPKGLTPHFLMGNHEKLLSFFLTQPPQALSVGNIRTWLSHQNGGATTFRSYGIEIAHDIAEKDIPVMQRAMREAMPAAHKAFLRDLKLYQIIGDYIFVHAGLRPGVALEDQTERDMLLIKPAEMKTDDLFCGKVLVHGHAAAEPFEIAISKNRIETDSSAYYSGILSCVVLRPGARTSVIQAKSTDVSP